MVTHCFIDGKTWFVTGIRVSDNNRTATVLQIFDQAMVKNGVPSRVRGDHGTENGLVAAHITDIRGNGRGSYIWGRSVHNIRIERLWRDYYTGIIESWYLFFGNLERYRNLDVDNPTHIWLLHHLFLGAVNEEALQWVSAWNSHGIQTENYRTPREMFAFGMAENGARGIGWLEDGVEPGHYQEYGVDWEFLQQPQNARSVGEMVQEDGGGDIEQIATRPQQPPTRMNEVRCDPPNSPLSTDQERRLDWELWNQFSVSALNMTWDQRKALWLTGLDYLQRLLVV